MFWLFGEFFDSFNGFDRGVLGVWTDLPVLRGRVLDVWTLLIVLGWAFLVFGHF